jgi:hypothetical protein
VEDEKVEKGFKVRCISEMNFKDLTKGKEYTVVEEEPQGYKIINDNESIMRYHKSLFEKVEDVLMVECINNSGMKSRLSLSKIYHVKKEIKGRYILEETGEAYEFNKNRFKLVEPQKEEFNCIRKTCIGCYNEECQHYKEIKIETYSVMELLDFEVGTKFKDEDDYCVEIVNISEESKEKTIKCIWNNEIMRISTLWLKAKFTKIEEPKTVTTAEAFKALEEGKIIESIVSNDKYRKENGTLFIKAKGFKNFCTCGNITSKELMNNWIIIE